MLDAAIVGARLLQFASAAVLFGSPLFYLYALKRLPDDFVWLRRLFFAAGAAVFVSCGAAVLLQAVSLGDVGSGADIAFLCSMLSETGFGKVLTLRLVLAAGSIAAFMALTRTPTVTLAYAETILGGALLASYAWTGHAAAGEGLAGTVHTASDAVHLLAAGVWIGALVCLAILLRHAAVAGSVSGADLAFRGLMRFSDAGLAVVALLVLSGLVNSWFLIGPSHLVDLLATSYGLLLMLKLSFFGCMLALAAANRYRLVPDLQAALAEHGSPAPAIAALKRSVCLETASAVFVLVALSWLGTLEPPASLG